jgi:hypothetical protein
MRRGYGTGRGAGYKNLAPLDPYIHSMNRKGVRVTAIAKPIKSKTPHLDAMRERTDIWSAITGKTFRKDFGMIPTPKKKGLIKEIARSVIGGAKWALEWEKEHLPAQAQWVKDEFNAAKDETIKLGKMGLEKAKEAYEWEKEKLPSQVAWVKKEVGQVEEGVKEALQKKQDLHDVRDELDTNDDGVQDISMAQLEIANKNIVKGLDKIDLNKNGVPDHREEDFTEISSIKVPTPHTQTNAPCPPEPPEIVKKENAFHKIKDIVDKGYAMGERYIHEKQEEQHRIEDMTDAELMKNAIRKNTGLFFLGGNRWETELKRRETEKVKLAHELKMIRQKAYENLPTEKSSDPLSIFFPSSSSSASRRESKSILPALPDPLERFR